MVQYIGYLPMPMTMYIALGLSSKGGTAYMKELFTGLAILYNCGKKILKTGGHFIHNYL